MAIKKDILRYDQSGAPICRFTIPNQTGDYVELTNLGCKVSGIHIHKLDGFMENIAAASGCTLWSGSLGSCLSDKVWEIAEESDNSVLLTFEFPAGENSFHVDLRLGLQVTWVNLDRLIVDYFITPKDNSLIDFETNLDIANSSRAFYLRSFCPVVLRNSGEKCDVQGTEYRELDFVPLHDADRFIHFDEEIKPMVELSDKDSALRISVYSTLPMIRTASLPDTLSIICSEDSSMELHAGETLANRMIFGFDYIEDVNPDDTEPSPFTFFL